MAKLPAKSPLGRGKMPSLAPKAGTDMDYGAGSGMGRMAKAGMSPTTPPKAPAKAGKIRR